MTYQPFFKICVLSVAFCVQFSYYSFELTYYSQFGE